MAKNVLGSTQPNKQQADVDGEFKVQNRAMMRLPEVIQTIANNVNVLWWNERERWYEVLDGPRFEEQFNALRLTRGKRKAEAVDRPFARMHVHFELLRGDKWAGTGSAFRPRVVSDAPPVSTMVSAMPVNQESAIFCAQPERIPDKRHRRCENSDVSETGEVGACSSGSCLDKTQSTCLDEPRKNSSSWWHSPAATVSILTRPSPRN